MAVQVPFHIEDDQKHPVLINRILDSDEIFLGLAADENGNGILDECEGDPLPVREFVIIISREDMSGFYRADTIRTLFSSPFLIVLEYQGQLEEAESVDGPWTPVE